MMKQKMSALNERFLFDIILDNFIFSYDGQDKKPKCRHFRLVKLRSLSVHPYNMLNRQLSLDLIGGKIYSLALNSGRD